MQSDAGNKAAKVIKEFRKKNDKPILKAAHLKMAYILEMKILSTLQNLNLK